MVLPANDFLSAAGIALRWPYPWALEVIAL